MRPLALINLVIAFVATTAPLAHVLEMASKLTLDGPLWLAIQHNLYRGWGDVFGPVEILALLTSLWLLAWSRNHTALFRTYLIATACYGLMLACFFVFNAPVNDALNGWTAATLPQDWTVYRIRFYNSPVLVNHEIHIDLTVFAAARQATSGQHIVSENARRDLNTSSDK